MFSCLLLTLKPKRLVHKLVESDPVLHKEPESGLSYARGCYGL